MVRAVIPFTARRMGALLLLVAVHVDAALRTYAYVEGATTCNTPDPDEIKAIATTPRPKPRLTRLRPKVQKKPVAKPTAALAGYRAHARASRALDVSARDTPGAVVGGAKAGGAAGNGTSGAGAVAQWAKKNAPLVAAFGMFAVGSVLSVINSYCFAPQHESYDPIDGASVGAAEGEMTNLRAGAV
eukprot:g3792.t1